jgi:hypothetical protein
LLRRLTPCPERLTRASAPPAKYGDTGLSLPYLLRRTCPGPLIRPPIAALVVARHPLRTTPLRIPCASLVHMGI